MADIERDDTRTSIPLDPEEALKALLRVDPEAEPVEDGERCPVEDWADNGVQRCALHTGHLGPHQLRS